MPARCVSSIGHAFKQKYLGGGTSPRSLSVRLRVELVSGDGSVQALHPVTDKFGVMSVDMPQKLPTSIFHVMIIATVSGLKGGRESRCCILSNDWLEQDLQKWALVEKLQETVFFDVPLTVGAPQSILKQRGSEKHEYDITLSASGSQYALRLDIGPAVIATLLRQQVKSSDHPGANHAASTPSASTASTSRRVPPSAHRAPPNNVRNSCYFSRKEGLPVGPTISKRSALKRLIAPVGPSAAARAHADPLVNVPTEGTCLLGCPSQRSCGDDGEDGADDAADTVPSAQ
eukprot:Rmarinus@m.20446